MHHTRCLPLFLFVNSPCHYIPQLMHLRVLNYKVNACQAGRDIYLTMGTRALQSNIYICDQGTMYFYKQVHIRDKHLFHNGEHAQCRVTSMFATVALRTFLVQHHFYEQVPMCYPMNCERQVMPIDISYTAKPPTSTWKSFG